MTYYVDGYTLGSNPSSLGGGYSIVNDEFNIIEKGQIEKAHFTNNEGEILGLYRALEIAKKGDIIFTDSENSISWAKKGKSKPRPDLFPLLDKVRQLYWGKGVKVEWQPRDGNYAGQMNEFNPNIEPTVSNEFVQSLYKSEFLPVLF